MKKLLFLLPALLLLAWCWKQATPGVVVPITEVWTIAIVEVSSTDYTGVVATWNETYMEEEILIIQTWSVSVEFEAQPTQLAWDYSGNWAILRAWAAKNVKTLAVPAWVKNVTITFKMAKASKYINIPGNIDADIDGKHLANWRLSAIWAFEEWPARWEYKYTIDCVTTQDKPNCANRSAVIGHTLTIKARAGENGNRFESITINYDL